MTRSRYLLAVALLALASLARAESLHLVAPAAGATLRGGSFAELRWSAGRLPASAEEWEAFLSVDGGEYYAFRITPHLDIGLRRFTFVVPNVETRQARILIRTGDEVQETHFESPVTFSIVRDAGAEKLLARLVHYGRAEAARESDPPVLGWTDGARNGTGVTEQSSPVVPSPSLDPRPRAESDAPDVLPPAACVTSAPQTAARLGTAAYGRAPRPEPPANAVDLLLVCRRRNI